MCRELSAIGTKEPQYNLVAFIMKATVWANVLEEGQENTIYDQKRPESDKISDHISDHIKIILELIKENPQICPIDFGIHVFDVHYPLANNSF